MEIVLVGAGGHAREIAGIIADLDAGRGDMRVVGIAADWGYEAEFWLDTFGLPCLGDVPSVVRARPAAHFIAAMGDGTARLRIGESFVSHGWNECPPLVHPSATVGFGSTLDRGVVVFPGARVSVNVRVKRSAHVNVGATIGHDSTIESYASLNPGATISGNVTVGARCVIGANATVLEGRTIANEVVVGAGAVVTKDVVDEGVTLVGVPARILTTKG